MNQILMDEYICGSDLPDLDPVHDGGPMLLAYCSACYGGYDGSPQTSQLYYKFLQQGAKAHVSFMWSVGDQLAYNVADDFYYYLEAAKTIQQSYDYARQQNGLSTSEYKLKGDGSIRCVD